MKLTTKKKELDRIVTFLEEEDVSSATLTVETKDLTLEIYLIPKTRKKVLRYLLKDIKKRLKPRT